MQPLDFQYLITPPYLQNKPNETILLYEGDIRIHQQSKSYSATGKVYFQWFPLPNVGFEATLPHPIKSSEYENILASEVSLGLKETSQETPFRVSYAEDAVEKEHVLIKGVLRNRILVGSEQPCQYLKFHLANLSYGYSGNQPVRTIDNRHFNRILLEAEGWRVIIDQFEDKKSFVKKLESQGGFMLTDVGVLQRTDNSEFTLNDAKSCLEVVDYFLSFIQGFRTQPLLLVAYDSEHNVLYREWSASQTAQYKHVFTWSWSLTFSHIAGLFPAFWNWFKSWGEKSKILLHWYLESTAQAGAVEGALVFQQVALEMIAWKLLEGEFLNKDTKNQYKEAEKKQYKEAEKKIDALLKRQKIPQAVPQELTNLIKFAEIYKAGNGPKVFTKVRNQIVHSAPKNYNKSAPKNYNKLVKIMPKARTEAWLLGTWYLELIFLSLLDYQGIYCKHLWEAKIEEVPWKNSEE